MEELKSQLRKLVLREPSSALDERVQAALDAEHPPRVPRVSVLWAAAAALLMGAVGFWAGMNHGWQPEASHRPAEGPSETIRFVVDSTAAGNPFDFSSPVDDRVAGEWTTRVTLIEDTDR